MPDLEDRGRIWAEYDLDNLIHNYRQAKKRVGGAKVLAIVKADAYGHGAVEISRALEAEGAAYFAVAAPEEALQLRAAGIRSPLLLLGVAPDIDVAELAEHDVELAVNTVETAERFSRLAGGRDIKVHIQLDTGMSRLGLDTVSSVEQAGEQAIAISRLPHIKLEGMYTHLCVADMPEEDEFTRNQIRLFKETTEYVKAHGVDIPVCHCANSAGILRFPEATFDMVREGIILYGIAPDPSLREVCELRPVMSIRTRIMQVKTIKAGTSVGYGRSWKAPQDADIATVGVGYADGIIRENSNKISMLVHGRRAKNVGRICMDITMLDVTGIPCKPGDVVTVLGPDGEDRVLAEELIEKVDTVPDEFVCNISKRVPRLYVRGGKVTARTEYIL